MSKTFCKKCRIKINTTPIFGERYQEFDDGVYCWHCAAEKLGLTEEEKKRLNKNPGEDLEL
jgi:hypothetical protein